MLLLLSEAILLPPVSRRHCIADARLPRHDDVAAITLHAADAAAAMLLFATLITFSIFAATDDVADAAPAYADAYVTLPPTPLFAATRCCARRCLAPLTRRAEAFFAAAELRAIDDEEPD